MPSAIDSLPQETVDAIVDFAIQPASQGPSHCAGILSTLIATSRHFQHRSWMHLYRRITLLHNHQFSVWKLKDHLESTVDLFENARDLSRYVKEVFLIHDIKDVTLGEYDILDERRRDRSVRIAVQDSHGLLATVFSLLGSLEVFKVHHDGIPEGGNVLWNDIASPLCKELSAMVAVRSRNTLKTLKMAGIKNIPLPVLCAFPHLESLHVSPFATVDDSVAEESEEVPWVLKSLSASCSVGFLNPQTKPNLPIYARLTHLRLYFDKPETYVNGWHIIHAASDTLVGLNIQYNACKDDAVPVGECMLLCQHSAEAH
jgi:hypothetical protein